MSKAYSFAENENARGIAESAYAEVIDVWPGFLSVSLFDLYPSEDCKEGTVRAIVEQGFKNLTSSMGPFAVKISGLEKLAKRTKKGTKFYLISKQVDFVNVDQEQHFLKFAEELRTEIIRISKADPYNITDREFVGKMRPREKWHVTFNKYTTGENKHAELIERFNNSSRTEAWTMIRTIQVTKYGEEQYADLPHDARWPKEDLALLPLLKSDYDKPYYNLRGTTLTDDNLAIIRNVIAEDGDLKAVKEKLKFDAKDWVIRKKNVEDYYTLVIQRRLDILNKQRYILWAADLKMTIPHQTNGVTENQTQESGEGIVSPQ